MLSNKITLDIEYGPTSLSIAVPAHIEVKGMGEAPPPIDREAVVLGLTQPYDSPGLPEVARTKAEGKSRPQAVIVVSDHTRPVPYRGESGILVPMLEMLENAGFQRQNICILIGAGSHRNMMPEEIEHMLGLKASGWEEVQVENHEYENEDHLTFLGYSSRGSLVKINRRYLEADLKIVTGLVESHFMAGASGGRKGICPGIVGKETLEIFHGGKMLHSQQAADLILDGNPLSEESTEIALMAGCDFLVNATIDAEKRNNGVFAGDMLAAHKAAVETIKGYVSIPLNQAYDIVLIPAGFVGVNHYQAGKAAIEAMRAVKPGGQIVLLAKHTEPDPIGGKGYKQALQLLHEWGKNKFVEAILQDGWELIQEQWQVQMYCKVLQHIGEDDHLIYCNTDIPEPLFAGLPGKPGYDFLSDDEKLEDDTLVATQMVERALDHVVERSGKERPSILFLKDGPYGIPRVSPRTGGA